MSDESEEKKPFQSRDAFSDELCRLIDRYRVEFDLTYSDAIAVLEVRKYLLCRELEQVIDEGNNDDE